MCRAAGGLPKIRRRAISDVKGALASTGCVGLFGPRQVGKSAIAHSLVAELSEGAEYLDLREHGDRDRLAQTEQFFAAHAGKLIVLDEAHCMVEAFDIVRRRLERQIHGYAPASQFLLLGSSTADVQRLAAERLGSRLKAVELRPIQLGELPAREAEVISPGDLSFDDAPMTGAIAQKDPPISLEQLWLRGGFPRSLLAADDNDSWDWRTNYLRTCFDRDAAAFGGAISPDGLREFLEEVAGKPAGTFNVSTLPRAKRWCLEFLERQGLIRRLKPGIPTTKSENESRQSFTLATLGFCTRCVTAAPLKK